MDIINRTGRGDYKGYRVPDAVLRRIVRYAQPSQAAIKNTRQIVFVDKSEQSKFLNDRTGVASWHRKPGYVDIYLEVAPETSERRTVPKRYQEGKADNKGYIRTRFKSGEIGDATVYTAAHELRHAEQIHNLRQVDLNAKNDPIYLERLQRLGKIPRIYSKVRREMEIDAEMDALRKVNTYRAASEPQELSQARYEDFMNRLNKRR